MLADHSPELEFMDEPKPTSPRALQDGESRGKKLRRWWRLVVLLLVLGVMLQSFEHNQVYHPTRDGESSPEDVGHPAEVFFLTTPDGLRLHAWFFLAAKDSPRARLAMLYCHGNGGNLTSRPDYYRSLLETGVNLLTFDYRGYGQSEGSPDEEGTYTDAQAAYQWLRARGFAPEEILVWGESLGGGIASGLASRERVGGLALQSAFTSVPDLGAELFPWLPVRLLSRINYGTRERLPQITCPILFLHSRADTTIPFRHAEENFAAANEPKLLFELEGDHNDALVANQRRYVQGAEAFVRLVELPRVATPGKPAGPPVSP